MAARCCLTLASLIDVEPPEPFGALDSGLLGCLSPAAQCPSAQTLERFPTMAEVRAALAQVRPGLLFRLRGRPSPATALAERLREEYSQHMWGDLVTAVGETSKRGHYLGLGMST